MTWDTTDITSNDIIVQDGVFAYTFEASGTIYKGQAVCICGDEKVMPCNDGGTNTTESDVLGIASYGSINGRQISIAGPGNIALCCTSGTVPAGTAMYGIHDGCLHGTKGNATKIAGYMVTESVLKTTHYEGKVLLV